MTLQNRLKGFDLIYLSFSNVLASGRYNINRILLYSFSAHEGRGVSPPLSTGVPSPVIIICSMTLQKRFKKFGLIY